MNAQPETSAKKPYEEIDAAEALRRLREGLALDNCRIALLDLGSDGAVQAYERPVVLRRCAIGELVLSGARFAAEFRVEGTVVEKDVTGGEGREETASRPGGKRPAAIFEGHSIWLGSGILGDLDLVGVRATSIDFRRFTVEGRVRVMGVSLEGQLAAGEFQFHGNLDGRGATVKGGVSLARGRLGGSLLLAQSRAGSLRLKKVEIAARVDASQMKSQDGALALKDVKIGGELDLRASLWREVEIEDAECAGRFAAEALRAEGAIELARVKCGPALLRRVSANAVRVRASSIESLAMPEAAIRERFLIAESEIAGAVDWSRAAAGEWIARKTRFGGPLAAERLSVRGDLALKACRFQGRPEWHRVETDSFSLRRSTFEHGLRIDRSTIRDRLDLAKIQAEGPAAISGTDVEGLVVFFGATFAGLDLKDCRFRSSVLFHMPASWRGDDEHEDGGDDTTAARPAHVRGPLGLAACRFHDVVAAAGLRVDGDLVATEASFAKDLDLTRARIGGDCRLEGARAEANVGLASAEIAGDLRVEEADVHRRLDLRECRFRSIAFAHAVFDHFAISQEQALGRLLHDSPGGDRARAMDEYLLLRRAFREDGHHEAEDWAHWRFRRMVEYRQTGEALAELRRPRGRRARALLTIARNLFLRVFFDAGSGYGTQPARVAALALATILAFGLVYASFPDQIVSSDAPGAAAPFYFSTVTFTTIGFSDLHPRSDGWLKYVVALEAIAGVVLMTLFVGTWTRKIIR